MTASSEAPVGTAALLQVLEQERRYYEVLRGLARDQRRALAGGRMEEAVELLSQQEPQVHRAAETTGQRLALESTAGGERGELPEARAEALKSLRLFAVENRQNLTLAQGRLDEIHLSLGALSASEERPAYPGSAVPAGAGPMLLDRKA